MQKYLRKFTLPILLIFASIFTFASCSDTKNTYDFVGPTTLPRNTDVTIFARKNNVIVKSTKYIVKTYDEILYSEVRITNDYGKCIVYTNGLIKDTSSFGDSFTYVIQATFSDNKTIDFKIAYTK